MAESKEDGLFRRARTYLEEKFFPLHRHEIFTRRDIWDALNLSKVNNATEYKAAIDRVIYYLTETQRQPSLKREGRGFRIVNRDLNIVEWWTGESTPLEINWPRGRDDTTFYFNDNITIYPKDIIVLAGESNQGKTALCLNFLADNMEKYPVTYFTSSDLGKEKFKDRIRSFDWVNFMNENGKPKFDLVHQDKNYEDTIQPDNINIIDWLLMTDEMWKIADKMLEYKNCLDKGIVILALQKPRGRDTAYGGEWTKMHASVYLSLSYDKTAMHNVLCVEKCKAPGIEDPNYKKFSFYLKNGAKLMNITEIV